jgi:hypothetical protein
MIVGDARLAITVLVVGLRGNLAKHVEKKRRRRRRVHVEIVRREMRSVVLAARTWENQPLKRGRSI